MSLCITRCTAIVIIAACSMLSFASEPPASLEITIPDYEVTMREDNIAYVSIPGGEILHAEQGRPQVPYIVKTIDYPRGYRVQKIELVQKSGLKPARDLYLPIVSYGKPEQLSDVKQDWYPAEDFTWDTWENRDASTTVILKVYPFHYNPATTDIEFYTDFLFAVTYVKTDLSLSCASLDREVYVPGEAIEIEIDISCGEGQHDVVLSSTIKQYGSEEIQSTLPDKTLNDISGIHTTSLNWSTEGVSAGDFIISIVMKDAAGNLLDKEHVLCRLGVSNGEITNFEVTPQCYERGDTIDIVLDFKNAGSRMLDGTCIFKIKRGNEHIAERTHEFNGLKPGASIRFSDIWDTRQTHEGDPYYVIGYVLHNGTATPAQHIMISTNAFPEVHLTISPQTPKSKEQIMFDASQSQDTDGEIVECTWEFGDGARATGMEVTHQYMLPGDYMVFVTVTDHDGGSNSDSLLISIAE